MKMVSAGAGLGVGVKDFRVIFVFETDKAFNQFLNSGWSVLDKPMRRPRQGESPVQRFRSGRSFLGRVRLPDYQEWLGAAVDAAGDEVLQGRRSEQITDGRLGPGQRMPAQGCAAQARSCPKSPAFRVEINSKH